MNALEKRGFLSRYPWTTAPIQLALLGFCLTFATPMCCALFSQRASISVSRLEPELQVSYSDYYLECNWRQNCAKPIEYTDNKAHVTSTLTLHTCHFEITDPKIKFKIVKTLMYLQI